MADDQDHSGRTGLKVAFTFGVIAATIQMGAILWLMYC